MKPSNENDLTYSTYSERRQNVTTSIPTTKASLTPPTVTHSSNKLIRIPDFGDAWGMLQPTQELVFKTFGYGILN